ncbi:DUF4352 domain-containing protein [Micromonospora sp. NBC_01740]|uniref:DUF4352 domain-containing protein n=1 Tax=Micromonospora sp. NBC_01740 TaxID=2975986 RepID=UPI002E135F75|nr:DUF4352 domain-containing protein [Micromonospora sp. NBC_01740]
MTDPGHPSQNQPYAGQPDNGPPPYGPPPTAAYPAAPARRKRPSWLIPTLIGLGAMVALCCGVGMVGAILGDSEPASVSSSAEPTAAAADASPAKSAPAPSAAATPPAAAPAKPSPAKQTGPKVYRVGDKVRGGDFEFTVNSVKCGISQVGDSFLNRKAQGTYCRVSISVKNVTKSAHLFHADGTVTVQDAAGREYDADGAAGMYGNDDARGFLDEINPGNSVRANVFFDVPKGTKLKTITFDAGLFTLAEDAVVSL